MRVVVLTLLLFTVGSFLRADESLFEFRRELSVPEGEGIGTFGVDAEMYEALAPEYRDLRVIRNRDGELLEWPFLIRKVSRQAVKLPAKNLATETESFQEAGDGSIETVIRLKGDQRGAATLRIDTPLRDFEKSVDVYGSKDGADWVPLLNDELIFDRERFIDFRRTELTLPENDFSGFRIVIGNATDEQRSSVREVTEAMSERGGPSREQTLKVTTRAFRINALSFYTAPIDQPGVRGEADYPVRLVSTALNEETRQTEVMLKAGRVPLNALTLETGDENFRREVRLEVPAGEERWRTIKRGVLFRYRVGDVEEENLTLRFDEQRSEGYRLIIENGDSPSLGVSGIRGSGDVYEARFLVDKGDQFSLLFGAGSPALKEPQYDVAALQRAEKAKVEAIPLALEEVIPNPAYQAEARSSTPLFEQPWVLWVLIAVVVAVLIRVLFGAAKRVEGMED